MIRLAAIGTMIAFLCLLFYLPSVYTASRFLDQVRTEHELNGRYWGTAHAVRVLDRTLTLHGDVQTNSAVQQLSFSAPSPAQIDSVAAHQLYQASARLLNNQYTRSIDALVTLFLFRISALFEWLPLVSTFVIACLLDGYLRRAVKSKEFVQHDPELLATYVVLGILVCCGTLVLCLLPITCDPLVFVAAPALVALFANQAVANYRARG